jgi:DNA (cytosine-5)-methyltransferase 1
VPGYYEFFAGGGMASLGLGPGRLWANDICPRKAAAYRENFGGGHFVEADILSLTPADLPGRADLAWASFPCQDLSLAGARGGLGGERSGLFWAWLSLMRGLEAEGRAPETWIIENVAGLLSSRGGADFAALVEALAETRWVSAAIIDAAHWLPQSRPRLFVVASAAPLPATDSPSQDWAPKTLRRAVNSLPPHAAARFSWPDLPNPPQRRLRLEDILEPAALWDSPAKSRHLLGMASPADRARIAATRRPEIGAAFRRTRPHGQALEIRWDGLAGCLRTPAGGSSRQIIVRAEDGEAATRLLTPREAARLMGLPDDYRLPARPNDALRLAGDGVAVPAVRFLADWLAAARLRA